MISTYGPSPGFPFGGGPARIPFGPTSPSGIPPGGIAFEGGYQPPPPVQLPAGAQAAGGQNPFHQLLQSMFARPEAQQWLMGLFGGQMPQMGQSAQGAAPGAAAQGAVNPFAGAQGMFGNLLKQWGSQYAAQPGTPGPAPSPFQGLNRFAGPFGNGGGPITPGAGLWQQK